MVCSCAMLQLLCERVMVAVLDGGLFMAGELAFFFCVESSSQWGWGRIVSGRSGT